MSRYTAGSAATSSYSSACGHCAGRAPPGEVLLLCGGCRSTHYCNAQCQKAAWKAGHKEECKERQRITSALLGQREVLTRDTDALFRLNTQEQLARDEGPGDIVGNIDDVPTLEQPPLVPGGPVIRAGGGRNWKYKTGSFHANAVLIAAASHGDPHLLKQLLEQGEDVHARGEGGITALFMAVIGATQLKRHDGSEHRPYLHCMDVLLQHGADPNAVTATGDTSAQVACYGCDAGEARLGTVLRRLMDAGADLSLKGIGGHTPQMLCVVGSPEDLLVQRLEVEYAATRRVWKKQLMASAI